MNQISPQMLKMSGLVDFNDNAYSLLRSPSGNYIFEKNSLTKEQLVVELKRKSELEKEYGIIAFLNNAERKEFNVLLKGLPKRPNWIQYKDPLNPYDQVSK